MRILSFLLAMALGITPANALQFKSLMDFYSNVDYGQLGFFRYNDKETPLIDLLEAGSDLTLPERNRIRFIFNPVVRDRDESSSSSYVAILMFLAHEGTQADGKPSVTIKRNQNWYRDNCYRPGCFNMEGIELQFFDRDLAERVRLHYMQDDISLVDKDFKGKKFDGKTKGSDLSSWDDREFWTKYPINNQPECKKENVTCEVKLYLLRFQPTANTPINPLAFDAYVSLTRSACFYVFSPTETAFAGHYCLKFSPQ